MIGHEDGRTFGEASLSALEDPLLQEALKHATDTFATRRRNAIRSVDDWEGLRERARAVKAATLDRLDHYLEEFVGRAEASGATVHFASDGEAACKIVVDLCRGASGPVVKSKSMTTEEIALNSALTAAGLDPIETDLGEWIIQQAGETPSHIIVPAIHKTRGQIGDLFARVLGMERSEDPEVLTAAARGVLREKFAAAEIGISGVNFAIAETGSILILENEGNVRLTTSLPQRHIAVMGIEKLLPRLSDLDVFLKLLPRSGTGQHLTSYQSLLTGPAAPGSEGPGELHIVVLDNGRSRLLEREVTRQSLACIRCGACLNVCPVYQKVGGHAYGSVYPGPIGAVITPQLSPLGDAADLPFASTLCGACRDVCPVKIDLPELLLDLRQRVVTEVGATTGHRHRWAFGAWSYAHRGPRRYAIVKWATRRLVRLAGGGGRLSRFVRWSIPPLSGWLRHRTLRTPAPRSFLTDVRRGR